MRFRIKFGSICTYVNGRGTKNRVEYCVRTKKEEMLYDMNISMEVAKGAMAIEYLKIVRKKPGKQSHFRTGFCLTR